MDLKEIYKKSKGVLSHTERDFYLAFCSHADNDSGFCFPKISTVAEMVEVLPQSASRLYKKLVSENFLLKVKGGHLCLAGFDPDLVKYKPDVNKTKPDVNFYDRNKQAKTKPDVNKSKHSVNTSKPDVNSHIKEGTTHITTHLTKPVSNETGAPKKKSKPVDERKNHPAIKMVLQMATRYPHKNLWERIIREIGDNPDTEFFRKSYEIWLSVNGNPMNLQKWLFDPNTTKKLPEIYGSKVKSPEADLLSPDYEMPKKKLGFEEIMMIFYDGGIVAATAENYQNTKNDFLKAATDKNLAQAEINDYERSDEYRKIFGQAEPGDAGGNFNPVWSQEHSQKANSLPVSR